MLRRLQDNAATLHRGSPKARVEAKAKARANLRAHNEVTGLSRRDATDHVADNVQRVQPLGKADAPLGPDSAPRMPC